MKIVQATTLALILSAALLASVQSQSTFGGIVDRAHRVLQAAAPKITLKKDDTVKAFCDDKDIPEADISISAQDRKDKQAKISGRYSAVITNVDEAMANGGSNNDQLVKAAFGTGLGFGIIIAILAFLSLAFLFFWSIFECCCEKTCCIDAQKKEEGRGWFRWCCYITSAVLGLTTIALTIAWSVYLGKMASRAPEIKCAMAIMRNDIINGVKINDNSFFVGLDQSDILLKSFVDMFDSFDSIKTNANNIKARDLTNKANSLVNKAASFKTSFSTSGYTYTGLSAGGDVTIGYATQIRASLTSDALKTEAQAIADNAKSIDNAGTTIANYDSASTKASKDSLNQARTNMNTGLRDPINKYYDTLVAPSGGADPFDQIKKASQGFMAASIVIMIGFTIMYLLILACNIKDKCHALKCISKIIMLIQLLLAVLILIMGAITTAISIFFTYGCVAIDGMITTPDYLATNFKGASIPSSLTKIVSSCLYEKGDGNLFTALGIELTNTNKISDITSGLQAYNNFKPNLTTQTTPWLGGQLSGNVTIGKQIRQDGPDAPTSENMATGVTTFNGYNCQGDKIVFNSTQVAGGGTASSTLDVSPGVGNWYFLRNDHKLAGYGNRYTTPGQCTGSGATEAAANALLQKVVDTQAALVTKYTALETDYNGNFYTDESTLFSLMIASKTDMDIIYDKVKTAVDYLNNAGSTLPAMLDCRVLQKEVIIISNILCFRFGEDIYQNSGLALALGFIIFVYSWVMCCSIRLANPKKDEEGQGALAYREGEGQAPQYQDGQNKDQYANYQ